MTKMKKIKTYFVSIAGRVPVNFETTIEAENEKEALAIALENDNFELSEPLWGEEEMDIKGKITHRKSGVYIEEQ